MNRTTFLRGITYALAAMHLLPARHHLADFVASPSLSDAWKGFGAVLAIAVLAAPRLVQLRFARLLWKHRAAAIVLAAAHLVPAADHLPKLAHAFTFGDAWRGIGAALAVALFLVPRIKLRSVALTAAGVALLASCAQNGLDPTGTGNPDASSGGGSCVACVIDSDCASGSVCAQLGGDSYCAASCTSQSDCASGEQCMAVSTITGDQAQVCVQTSSTTCGLNPSQPAADAGTVSACPGLADPSTKAACTSCTSMQQTCQANGCYGGWYCNEQTLKCQAPPTNCTSSADAGPPPTTFDGGVTGNIGPSGGTESNLFFAIVGDTRPAVEDDTSAYPSAIIGKIFSDLASLKTVPPFVVSTGDYQFSNPYGTQASAQLALYLKAKGSYPGVQFPAMGNHECTGGTSSNCGTGNTNGITNNYSAFMQQMLQPIQKTQPYYVINVNASNNAWTAKFVFIAANAWNSAQASWLDSALSQSTTYTFVVRHEPAAATTAPGVTPSENIMAKHPYTLAIVGHSHEYNHSKYTNPKQVVIGNGGAPLATSQDYGYGIVAQRSDGSLSVDMYDYQTNAADTSFHFAVNPDGSAAAP